MTTAGAVRSGPQCLQFPAAGPLSSVPHHRTQLGPARPTYLARPDPSTCSVPASVLWVARPGVGPTGRCRVLKTGRDLGSGRLAPAGSVHPRSEPPVSAQPEPCRCLHSEHSAQPRPGSAPSPRMRVSRPTGALPPPLLTPPPGDRTAHKVSPSSVTSPRSGSFCSLPSFC